MHITLITIFPELFENFIASSLVGKAVEKWILSFTLVNPRDFCEDKNKKVDDEIYGGGVGLLMKAEPVIASIKQTFHLKRSPSLNREEKIDYHFPPDKTEGMESFLKHEAEPRGFVSQKNKTKIILVWPSKTTFNQQISHDLSEYAHLIFICGRYEGIDHRVKLRCQNEFGENFCEISLGQFVTLWGEVPAMTMIEAITRLVPGVIKEELSRQDESYRPEQWMQNIEYPQYTRPEVVEGMSVPDVLLSGHHKNIEKWKKEHTS